MRHELDPAAPPPLTPEAAAELETLREAAERDAPVTPPILHRWTKRSGEPRHATLSPGR